jgi:WD40 repeat protein
LFALPAPGQILVAGTAGTWTVAANGTTRRLGSWREATWSPHGLYVAGTTSNQITAVNLRGVPQWSIARPDVRSPRWFSPNGYRLAYLSGTTLRVIAGDGTGDRKLAQSAAQVAPAWRPGHDYLLAYTEANGTVVARDADTGRVAWSHRVAGPTRLLAWSPDGARLLVLTRAAAIVLDGSGHQVAQLPSARNESALDGALSPDGQQLALLSGGDITLTDLSRRHAVQRRLFTGAGLEQLGWSPDGRWLLVTWPAADQWVFIHTAGQPRIIVVSKISEQFRSLGPSHAFPALEGWCCTAAGDPG